MSAKVTLIIGDYSNGWSDSVQAMTIAKFKTLDTLADREYTMAVLNRHVIAAVNELEASEKINPLPKDEKCCDDFPAWAKKEGSDSKARLCPFCGRPITTERKDKFFGKEF